MRAPSDPGNKLPLWKKILAGAGVVTIAVGVGYTGYNLATANAGGPSELTLHPERQDEINAQRKAEALRDELRLSPAQTEQVAEIYYRFRLDRREAEATSAGNPTARIMARMSIMQALEGEIMALLDEEQRAIFAENRLDRFGKLQELHGLVQRGKLKPILPEGQRPAILDRMFQNPSQ
jgi:hypothetical protein